MPDIARLRANGFRPMPLAWGTKAKGLREGFPDMYFAPEDFPDPCNVALLLGRLTCLDFDVDDPAEARRVEYAALGTLGFTPLMRERDDGSPRSAWFYLSNGNVKSTTLVLPQGGKVQVKAGAGEYMLAFGLHPEGGLYRWREESPEQIDIGRLPSVGQGVVNRFLIALGADIESFVAPRPAELRTALVAPVVRPVARPKGGSRTPRNKLLSEIGTAEAARAKAFGEVLTADQLALRIWTRFGLELGADLARRRADGRLYAPKDALKKARRELSPERQSEIDPMRSRKFWTLIRKAALLDLIERDPNYSKGTKAVARRLLDAVRDEEGKVYLSAATIARELGLHVDTVRDARAALVAGGYFRDMGKDVRGRAAAKARRRVVIEPVRTLVDHVDAAISGVAQMTDKAHENYSSAEKIVELEPDGDAILPFADESEPSIEWVEVRPAPATPARPDGRSKSLAGLIEQSRDDADFAALVARDPTWRLHGCARGKAYQRYIAQRSAGWTVDEIAARWAAGFTGRPRGNDALRAGGSK